MAMRPRRRLRPPPINLLVPNTVTVLGICAGLTSIRFALLGRYEIAVIALLVAMVCDALDFDRHAANADLVITGEGRADRSTAFDKAPVGIARRSNVFGTPTLLLAGSLGEGYDALYQYGIDAIIPIAEEPATLETSLEKGAELLERAAERAVRLYALGRNR